ncbi:hypothetical protein ElyMa_003468800 [Elysia marginata]|uniref:Uncharacterized protein n=1 Tax=Elysia marginata TaxID=1093978 RepID=A0AAV4EBB8_9GAST|nr:hypothetical protein ElyMa_003468800 [Elysia marginata]
MIGKPLYMLMRQAFSGTFCLIKPWNSRESHVTVGSRQKRGSPSFAAPIWIAQRNGREIQTALLLQGDMETAGEIQCEQEFVDDIPGHLFTSWLTDFNKD